jgi:hypothetical protein
MLTFQLHERWGGKAYVLALAIRIRALLQVHPFVRHRWRRIVTLEQASVHLLPT